MAARKAKGKPAKTKAKAKPSRKAVAAKPKSAVKAKKAAAPAGRKKPARALAEPVVTIATPFQLPERFDSAAASGVLDEFKRHRGNALTVDASAVRRVGAQGLQILLSATRTWQSDGHALSLENASAELMDAAQLLGLSHSELSISGSLQ